MLLIDRSSYSGRCLDSRQGLVSPAGPDWRVRGGRIFLNRGGTRARPRALHNAHRTGRVGGRDGLLNGRSPAGGREAVGGDPRRHLGATAGDVALSLGKTTARSGKKRKSGVGEQAGLSQFSAQISLLGLSHSMSSASPFLK